jgi:hypothetical protein
MDIKKYLKKNDKKINLKIKYKYSVVVIFIIMLFSYIIFKIQCKLSVKHRRSIPQNKRIQTLKKLLVFVNNEARERNIDLVLLFGTLLGYYRGDNIICHDYDVDVGVFNREHFYLLVEHFKTLPPDHKFTLNREYLLANEIRLEDKETLLNIDIQLWVKNGDEYVYYNIFGNIMYRYPISYIFPLHHITFLYQDVAVPAKTREVLEIEYGQGLLQTDHFCEDESCQRCVGQRHNLSHITDQFKFSE